MFTASVVASGTGTVTASIFPPLRTSLSVNDVVEIAAPKIEGHVLPGEELSWQLALDHTTGISFSVMEADSWTLPCRRLLRSEERRVGKEGGSRCRSRWS